MTRTARARPVASALAALIVLTLHPRLAGAQLSEIRGGASLVVSARASDGFLNMRREPSVSAEIVARLPTGSPVTATGRNETNGTTRWHQVQSAAGTGWVNALYLDPKTSAAPAVAGYAARDIETEGTHWVLNGSKLVLTIDGDTWTFRYLEPRPGMVEEGVRRGTILFKGRENELGLEGTAYRFSKRCGALPYDVSGEFEPDGALTLAGTGVRGLDQSCRTTHTEYYTLAFQPVE